MTIDAHALSGPISVLLLEDIASHRELWASWLRGCGFEVTTVGTLEHLEREMEHIRPDVALVDLGLDENSNDVNGFEAAGIIKGTSPETSVAAFTAYGPNMLSRHLPYYLGDTGELEPDKTFDGVVLKDMPLAEIADAIRRLHRDGIYIEARTLKAIRAAPTRLTKRELECVKGLANGMSHRDLERSLYLAPKSVYRALNGARLKLGVQGPSDGELVKAAADARLL